MTNVYIFPTRHGNQPIMPSCPVSGNAFDHLTDLLVMKQAAAGTLHPNIIAALLASVRNSAQEIGQ